MRFHNTLGRKTEDFKPIGSEVKLYSCGPTVYSYYHIGNLRNAVFNDTLRRALEANGFRVKQVMNITDVGHLDSDADEGEDKLQSGAKRENKSVWQVADFYIDAFKKDMAKLNVLPPNGYESKAGPYARATDFIDQQINIIKILTEKGFAYQTEEAIYFDVAKLPSYGELSGQKLSDKEVGVREEVVTDTHKHNPQDFGLWFFITGRFANHEMRWPSQWGEGFPGWHLECSAIIHATLGEPIDVHTGGVDHIGTHHPNEMAQTEAAFGVKLAKFWLHNEHLHVDGQKMSKSQGNLFTLKDVIDKNFDPLALRLLYLQAHYRSKTNFTWQSLDAAAENLQNLRAWADMIHQSSNLEAGNEEGLVNDLKSALADDLNSPQGLAKLNEFSAKFAATPALLKTLDSLLALDLSARPDISEGQKKLIRARDEARRAQDWPKADEIRKDLKKQSLELNDTQKGTVWSRL
jgi:cysteinyl-tRNA synthetase